MVNYRRWVKTDERLSGHEELLKVRGGTLLMLEPGA